MIRSRKIIHLAVIGLLLQGNGQAVAADTTATDARPLTTLTNDELAALMEDANKALREQQYNQAIEFYNRLIEMPDNAYRRDAIELRGLAQERDGKLDDAKKTYEYYLQLYPRGEGAERVRQRLAGLTTARWKAPPKLRETEEGKQKQPWRVYGSFYQYLYRNVSKLEGQKSVVNNNDITTGLDLNARGGVGAYNITSRVSGSDFHNLEGVDNNDQELSYLYVDVSQNNNTWAGRLGRQRANGGGVLSRFDGLNLGVQVTDHYRINLLAGSPVENTRDAINFNSGRNFYGVNLDIGPWAEYWQANTYYIQQQDNGILDREAVGAELRYNHPQRSLYSLIDYDIHFNELNIFNVQASYTNPNKTTYSLLLDHRNSPLITSNNALIGTGSTTLDELLLSFTENEIHTLALDRTAQNDFISLGMSQPINDTYHWDANISANKLSSTPASGGVAATDGTGVEYFLDGRLTALNLYASGDVNVVSIRLASHDSGNSISLGLNSLYPATAGLRINPRLQLTYQDYTDSGDKETTVGAGLRLEYYWDQLYSVEFDSGIDWTNRQVWFGNQKYQSYYFNLGYRIDF